MPVPKAGYLIKAISDGSYPSLTARESNQNIKNGINHFDFAASIGLGFYPTKKLGIDLRYNHGLTDITKNDVWGRNNFNTNRNVQFSLLYFFGKKMILI